MIRNAHDLEFGIAPADVRVETAAGRGDGIGRDRFAVRERVFFAVAVNSVFDRVAEFFGERRKRARAFAEEALSLRSKWEFLKSKLPELNGANWQFFTGGDGIESGNWTGDAP